MATLEIAFAGRASLLPTNVGRLRAPPRILTLNTVDYAVNVIHDKVLIPNASRLGPGYRIIGVMILLKPQYGTTSVGGITWRHGILNFFISDEPFVNGTTLDSDLYGHLVYMGERSSTGYGNSHDAALQYMAPAQLCKTDLKTNQQTCTAVQGNPGRLVQLRNTYLVVRPEVPNAYFVNDGVNRGIEISADLTYEKMLSLADSVIP